MIKLYSRITTLLLGILVFLLLVSCTQVKHMNKNDLKVEQFNHSHFKSLSLNDTWNYSIYLPKSYNENTNKRYAVIYFLHGMFDNNIVTANQPISPILNDAISKNQIGEVIVVIPDSRGDSWWVDSDQSGKIYTAFSNELITYIDSNYRTINKKESRSIMGLSMGGFGTLKQALSHSERFNSVVLLSPAVYFPHPFTQPKHSNSYTPSEGVGQKLINDGAFGIPFNESKFVENSYPTLLKNYKNEGVNKLNFILYYGNKDTITDNSTQHFIDYIKSIGIDMPTYALEGGHTWAVWLYAFSHLLNTRPDFISYE